MNDKEILMSLLGSYEGIVPAWSYSYNEIADFLIANGVTVQKQGRWEFHNTAYRCSECKAGFMMPVPYCWSCGAKMENTDGK